MDSLRTQSVFRLRMKVVTKMSEKVLSGEIHFFKLSDKPEEPLYDELTTVIATAIEEFNSKQKRGWTTGFVRIRTSELAFGEAAVCDECGVHYFLEDTDFKEVGNQLLCSVCQRSEEKEVQS